MVRLFKVTAAVFVNWIFGCFYLELISNSKVFFPETSHRCLKYMWLSLCKITFNLVVLHSWYCKIFRGLTFLNTVCVLPVIRWPHCYVWLQWRTTCFYWVTSCAALLALHHGLLVTSRLSPLSIQVETHRLAGAVFCWTILWQCLLWFCSLSGQFSCQWYNDNSGMCFQFVLA